MGEVVLAAPLVAALAAQMPERPLLVTTMTPTGRDEARRRFGDRVSLAYVPLDTPGAARRFIARARPGTGIFVETEIWPHLIGAASRAGVGLALVNASVSERSAARYATPILSQAVRFTLSCFDFIGAAEPAYADRFIGLGAIAGTVAVTGNLKYDAVEYPDVAERARQTRARWQAIERPIWIAASTHAPEESTLLKAFAELRARHPTLLLLIAPRHPQRFENVAALIAAAGWRCARRSLGAPVDETIDIVLVDTLGELNLFYALADLAFVGGSLVRGIGGHNVIEPAAAGVPLVTGPNIEGWREPLRDLSAVGSAIIARDLDGLKKTLDAWLSEPDIRRRSGDAGRAAVDQRRGSLQQTLAGLSFLLDANRSATTTSD